MRQNGIEPDIEVYKNLILYGRSRDGHILLDRLHRDGLSPDVQVYNALLFKSDGVHILLFSFSSILALNNVSSSQEFKATLDSELEHLDEMTMSKVWNKGGR